MPQRYLRFFIFSLLSGNAAFAQPVVNVLGPVNAASYRTSGLPGSGIARGSMFSLFGTDLGPQSPTWAYSFPLPTTLGGSSGTSVSVTVGNTTASAILLFASSVQINAILPSSVPAGTGTLTVTNGSQTSAPVPIHVVDSAFGIFAYNSAGTGQAIATDVNYQLNTIIHTFHPGDSVILWGTGLGPISASDAEAPPAGDVGDAITMHIGNSTAPVSYHGRAPCCAGLDQIVFSIPANIAGCHVPVGVETSGGVSNIGTIAISQSGQVCSDSLLGQDLVNNLASGHKVRFGLVRLESYLTRRAGQSGADTAVATFSELSPDAAGLAQYGVSSGYCVAVDCSWGCNSSQGAAFSLSLYDSSPSQLDAGSLSVQGDSTVALTRYGGPYAAVLSSQNGARFLWTNHSYAVNGTGGADVGAFSPTETAGKLSAQFTNLTDNQSVPRSSDLNLEWTGGDPSLQNGQVTIGGLSATSDFSNLQVFQCTAPLAPHQFTIPAWVLSTLPPSGSYAIGSPPWAIGFVWIGQSNTPVTFNPAGLDRAILTDIFYNRAEVNFQ